SGPRRARLGRRTDPSLPTISRRSFEDANRPSGFEGRFGADGSLTGTVTASLPESCGASSFAFAAHPG
ncbi:MAG: hypothetical protein QOI43_2147, partial [Gaiellales bacterium]|nr:hypothetical protein [Gaiellales bacterium]